jgi:hypothetical protein
LGVVVAVIVDKARRNHQPFGINGARSGITEFAGGHNLAVANRHIATECWQP